MIAEIQVISVDPELFDTLYLPAGLKQIDKKAFAGSNAQVIVLPTGCEAVGERAFADCPRLICVVVPSGSNVRMGDDCLQGSEAVLLYD